MKIKQLDQIIKRVAKKFNVKPPNIIENRMFESLSKLINFKSGIAVKKQLINRIPM